jgi:hypothetical protein
LFLPQFLKRCCRICGFEESKTDAELIKHIDLSHPRTRFWRDEKSESASNRVLNVSVPESGELAESNSSVSAAVEKMNKIVKKEVVEDILRKQTQVKKKTFLVPVTKFQSNQM